MNLAKKLLAIGLSGAMLYTAAPIGTADGGTVTAADAANAEMEWGTLGISGGGFVSGIITGQSVMYARTDVGGAYRYNYEEQRWEQLMSFISEADRGYLSVDAMAVDPTDDDTVYMLCGCAYFSDARTAVFKSTDGGDSWKEVDVTNLIQVHGNGYGRQCGESIAVDPDDPDTIYCGGDTTGMIVSRDGGETWAADDGLNALFTEEINWPTWTDHIVKTTGSEYGNSNGIATIAISEGKVYAGVSVIGTSNLWVSDIGENNWEPVSSSLPSDVYPSRINVDADGNLLISYVPSLTFGNGGGGAYRYDVRTDTVTDISPAENTPFGAVASDATDSSILVATSCGLWYSQLWEADDWENDCVSWGDVVYKSTDSGATWTQVSPGNAVSWGGPLQAEYLQDGGVAWVQHKAIHWSGAVVIDPRDSERILVTSGNGIFACDDIWESIPTFYFHATGVEEVVALDLVSVPGGAVYSAIGDYDGFIHTSITESEQYQPNMGSTNAIAYCPSNPDIMCRYSMDGSKAYYSTDAGKTWTQMANPGTGKAAITELEDGTYRIFRASGSNISYSDDFGGSWTASSGTAGAYVVVDPTQPNYVYSAGNDNNGYDPTCKPNNYLYVSNDYGASFTKMTICAYDKAEDYCRIAAAGDGTVYCPTGYYGLYKTTDYGATTTTLSAVDICFAVGVGKAKVDGDPLAVYMWGSLVDDDTVGIYRSDDGGESWVRINDDDHQYGGTGNGKFIVGDMNTYGTVYMSTVGMGIVYGQLTDGSSSTEPDDNLYGDVNTDGEVTVSDLILLARYLAEDATVNVTEQGLENADCDLSGYATAADLTLLANYLAHIIPLSGLGNNA